MFGWISTFIAWIDPDFGTHQGMGEDDELGPP